MKYFLLGFLSFVLYFCLVLVNLGHLYFLTKSSSLLILLHLISVLYFIISFFLFIGVSLPSILSCTFNLFTFNLS